MLEADEVPGTCRFVRARMTIRAEANKGERDHWPTSYALISLTPETERAIFVELLLGGYFRYTLML